VAPLVGRTRKCVVLDLDNTLWGGVVGEVGAHGIKLAATGPGSEFQEFQRFLAGLGRQGILLAINSKNNPEDAWEAIRNNDAMVLREGDFSAARINWQPKPENLQAIAKELEIGIDSLIFIDDNPNERERVRQFLPQVLVPELPADPSLYRSVVESLPELQRLEATAEDAQRVQLYREKRERESAREQVGSVEEYLETLQIRVEIARAGADDLPRVHQLFHRTNQFNTTTRRYELGEVVKVAEDPESRLYVLRASDRFGSHGLVAVALVRPEGARPAWRIDSFLMSCRVIGYGIETSLLAVIGEDAIAAGKTLLAGEFIPTAKNAPAVDLFSRHGFEVGTMDGALTLYERSLASGPIPRPGWLTLERTDAT
jgi:FkbH-like protein